MKKSILIVSAILLVTALSLSVMAFRDDEPKKQKTECTANKECEKDKTACAKSEGSSCCQKSCSKTSETSTEKDDASANKQ
jgi:hypothetical protein